MKIQLEQSLLTRCGCLEIKRGKVSTLSEKEDHRLNFRIGHAAGRADGIASDYAELWVVLCNYGRLHKVSSGLSNCLIPAFVSCAL
jgi:hypothetical protein